MPYVWLSKIVISANFCRMFYIVLLVWNIARLLIKRYGIIRGIIFSTDRIMNYRISATTINSVSRNEKDGKVYESLERYSIFSKEELRMKYFFIILFFLVASNAPSQDYYRDLKFINHLISSNQFNEASLCLEKLNSYPNLSQSFVD